MENFLLLASSLFLFGMSLIVFGALYSRRLYAKQKELYDLERKQEIQLLNSMLKGQELERERIAFELHDNLGAMLSTIKFYFKSIELGNEGLNGEKQARYDRANELLDETINEIRKISHNLSSSSVEIIGLIPALENLLKPIEETGRVKVDFISLGIIQKDIDLTIQVALYRIVGELVNNILRHSNATELTIQLVGNLENLHLSVEDNGIGFDVIQTSEGIGLSTIAARVRAMEGFFTIDSTIGHGTTIIIDIPHKNKN